MDSKAYCTREDNDGLIRVLDPTKTKLVVPSDATDQLCYQPLECNVRSHTISNKKINPIMQRMKLRASNHAIECSKRGTLVDRGANGGALGNDAKVTFRRNKSVDVTGIDNHELSS